MKSKNQKNLEKLASKLWFQRSQEKWGMTCTVCGKPAVQMHHFVPRSRSKVLKYDVMNAVPLCKNCHYKIHFSSKPSEIYRLVEQIRKQRGKAWCVYVDKMERETAHGLGVKWLKEVIKNLEK